MCIIECTVRTMLEHKLKRAFLEAAAVYIENVILVQFC